MSDLEGFGFVMPHWLYWGWLAFMPLIMIALDNKSKNKQISADEESVLHPIGDNKLCQILDKISDNSGIFVSFWTVNAVCFYFFEVVMRYIFNQPTIWVHEASFLLLGMQYLLAGGFALLHGSHVRVDVMYNFLPKRGRVGMDIFTSMFFFIFAISLMITSWTYFSDSYEMSETTVETWGIQHWPVKGLMLVGSGLLLMAGISKLIKDIILFIRMGKGLQT